MRNQCIVRRVVLLCLLVMMGMSASHGLAQPANDMFANRRLLTGTNVFISFSTAQATDEAMEPSHAGISGGASVWLTWTAPYDGMATISTAGSGFDTLLGVYAGSTVSTLTEIASNDDADYSAGISTSKVVVGVKANQTLQIAVDGYYGETGTARFSLQLAPLPSAPAWQLRDVNGALIRSTAYNGKVVMLDFWATWCGPCKAGMPDLVALQNKYRNDGLEIIGPDVSWSGDSVPTISSFLTTWTPAINYQVVISTAAYEQLLGTIQAIPTTFIIDRQNKIRQTYVGTQSRATLEKQIVALLYTDLQLNCRIVGNQLSLSWPAIAASSILESSSNLESTSWTGWPTAPTVSGGQNVVQVPKSGTPRYFRVRISY